jgi:hypothetical protein
VWRSTTPRGLPYPRHSLSSPSHVLPSLLLHLLFTSLSSLSNDDLHLFPSFGTTDRFLADNVGLAAAAFHTQPSASTKGKFTAGLEPITRTFDIYGVDHGGPRRYLYRSQPPPCLHMTADETLASCLKHDLRAAMFESTEKFLAHA